MEKGHPKSREHPEFLIVSLPVLIRPFLVNPFASISGLLFVFICGGSLGQQC